MKKVCIHQPDFVPYLGFFHRLLFVDVFVILDNVQFVRRGWHHRDKIKTSKGQQWLTLPIEKGDFHQKINQVKLSKEPANWIERHVNLLQQNYVNAPHFDPFFSQVRAIYESHHEKLIDLNMAFLNYFFDFFDLQIELVYASSLNVDGASNRMLLSIMREVEGSHYLSGVGARDYINEEEFSAAGVTLEWQEFTHPVYPQQNGPFVPDLSCLDLLFNCGPNSKEILSSCKLIA